MDVTKTIENVQTATFSDAKPATALKDLQVAVNPVQDLHGYDYPWPEGGGKNLLPLTIENFKRGNTTGEWEGNVYNINRVKFTLNADNDGNIHSIGVQNLNSGNRYAELLLPLTLNPGTYYLSSGYDEVQGDNDSFIGVNNETIIRGNSVSPGQTCTIENTVQGYYHLRTKYPNTDYLVYPILCLNSEADKSFTPYSNICPITGHDNVIITNTGELSSTESITIKLGGTIYGGTLDAVKGLLTISKSIVDLGTLAWSKVVAEHRFYTTGLVGSIQSYEFTEKADILCSMYRTSIWNTAPEFSIFSARGQVSIKDNSKIEMTGEEFAQYLSSAQLVYSLANPITVNLTPAQIYTLTALYSTNSISASTGSINRLTYVIDPLLLGRYFMINTGYILLDVGGLDLASSESQTIPGIFSRAVDAINTGKPIWLYNSKYSNADAYSPIPVFVRYVSTTSIVANAAGIVITIDISDAVTVAA